MWACNVLYVDLPIDLFKITGGDVTVRNGECRFWFWNNLKLGFSKDKLARLDAWNFNLSEVNPQGTTKSILAGGYVLCLF